MRHRAVGVVLTTVLMFVAAATGQLWAAPGMSGQSLTFGEIHGTRWNDLNSSGARESNECGVGQQVIYLDQNQNGVRDPGEVFTTTAADGSYSFLFLDPGSYTVAEDLDPNWRQAYPGSNHGIILYTDEAEFRSSTHIDSTERFDEFPSDTVLGDRAQATVDSVTYLGYYSVDFWQAGAGYGTPAYISSPNAMKYNGIEVEGCRLTFGEPPSGYVHSVGFWILSQPTAALTVPLEIIVEDVDQNCTSYEVNPTSEKLYYGFTSSVGIKQITVHGYPGAGRPQPWCFDNVSRSVVEYSGQWQNEHSFILAAGQVANNIDFGDKSTNPIAPCDPQPPHNSVGIAVDTDLAWFGDGITYDVCFGTDPNLGCGTYLGTTDQTSWDLPPLEPNTTYYWRLNFGDGYGFYEGPIWQFTTAGGQSAAPSRPSPPDLSTGNPLNVDLAWCGSGDNELVSNGGFESGMQGWTNSSGLFAIANSAYDPEGPESPSAAHTGDYYALFEPTGPGGGILSQDISIDPNASRVELSWFDRISNHYSDFLEGSQDYRVEVWNTEGQGLAKAYHSMPGDPLFTEWTERHFDLTAFKGQNIRVEFAAQVDMFFLNVGIDDVSVVENRDISGTTYDVYFGTNPSPGPCEFLGSTDQLSWNLPPLEPDTTYYWQVVGRIGCDSLPGPIWRFTTSKLDVPSRPNPPDQYLDVPLNTNLSWCCGSEVLFSDDMEHGTTGWTHRLISGQDISDDWSVSTARSVSGAHSWHSGVTAAFSGDTALESPNIDLTGAHAPVMTFNQWYHFDDCGGVNEPDFQPDGGIVEACAIPGSDWVQITPQNGYPGAINADACGNPLSGRSAYTRNNGGSFQQASFDLSQFAGQTIRVRFHAGWDCGNCVAEEGWYIDDVVVRDQATALRGDFDVYFGTNPTPGNDEHQGSTAYAAWDLPVLKPSTTYYWQIVAKAGSREVSGPVWQFTTTQAVTTGQAKLKADGEPVTVEGIVTAIFSDCFYVGSVDRISGLRVQGTDPQLKLGSTVRVTGTMGTNGNAERCLNGAEIALTELPAHTPVPIGLPNKAVGGGSFVHDPATGAGQRGITQAVGLNNIGLLIRTWGRVTASGSGPRDLIWMYLDDGSNVQDGSGLLGLYVEIGGGALCVPDVGTYVQVTGISSCEIYNSRLVNTILPRSSDDFVLGPPVLSGQSLASAVTSNPRRR